MSFGFRSSIDIVEDAITYAAGRKIIIFAAAANHGGNLKHIAFPALMGSVICIKSAQGNGISSNFNPSNTDDAGFNFSTLGEGVLSLWPMKETEYGIVLKRRQSGSSVATPIAAGIAALLLEFSRQPDENSKPGLLEESREALKSVDGMKILFRCSSMSERIGDCRYVVPWNLLDSQFTNGLKTPGYSDRSQAAVRIWSCLHQ
jgi:hypothetical protein